MAMQMMRFTGPSFEMTIPTTWTVTSSPDFQAMFLGKKENPATAVRPNLMVTIRPVEADVTPAAVAAGALEIQGTNYPEYQVLGEIDYSQQGGSGVVRQFSWRDPEQNIGVVQMQAFFAHNGQLYTLTGTRQADTDLEADTIFTEMINSFGIAE